MHRSRPTHVLMGIVTVAILGLVVIPVVRAQEPATTNPDAVAPASKAANNENVPAASAGPAAAPSSPPARGRVVGDHWTPYNPPAADSIPAGAQVHVIVKGDTLWDLGASTLQDPWLWPQIWEVNQYITDSHWIYPGDLLLIPGKPTVIGENGPPAPTIELLDPSTSTGMAPGDTGVLTETPGDDGGSGSASADEGSDPALPMAPVPRLEPLAGESDVYCSSYIVDHFERPDLHVANKEDDSRTVLGTGDIIFLNNGDKGELQLGAEYSIITYEGVVPHPIFSGNVGESVRMVGRVRVLALQKKTATAEITMACDGIEIGMPLVPFEEVPLPLATATPLNRYQTHVDSTRGGYIVDVTPDKVAIGEGDIINIDIGEESGLKPGDLLTVFREWSGAVEFNSTSSHVDGLQARAERARSGGSFEPSDYPQMILGQVVVLKTQKRTATVRVIASVREIGLGDRVAAK